MTDGRARWDDLITRTASGVLALGVGAAAVWAGGWWFALVTTAVAALMVWELGGMCGAGSRAPALAGCAGLALLAAQFMTGVLAVATLMIPAALGLALLGARPRVFALFAALIALAAYGLIALRHTDSLRLVGWLVAVVVATDIAGYFAGRAVGGPKLWPRLSPKKTWSGAVAGWAASAGVGALFFAGTAALVPMLAISVLASMASQTGDIAESALKRGSGVKDSSGLMPGHGGIFDRFDGMLGAALFVLIVQLSFGLPAGAM